MKKVIIASLNPTKIDAVKYAFNKMFSNDDFEFVGLAVLSGVKDQPMTDSETKLGALNRANNAKIKEPNADFWVGLEGGIDLLNEEMIAFAWMAIKTNDRLSVTRTATFTLPAKIKELVLGGMELGHADDLVFNKSNSKQANGAVGLLTGDIITRSTYYQQALILALIPFNNDDLY